MNNTENKEPIFKPYKVTSDTIDQLQQIDGQLIFTTDDNKIYLDMDGERILFEETATIEWKTVGEDNND